MRERQPRDAHHNGWPCKAMLGALCWWSLLMPAAVHAQAGSPCQPNGLPDAVLACAVRDAQHSDTALQLRYSAQMQSAPASQRPHIRKAHTAWMRERDRLCRERAQAHNGTEWALALQHCLRQENQRRQASLQTTALPQPAASMPR